ncbi:MAG TPA: tol-pal system-associated acyl-CoA thioesterase [Steroidobacteraceae bacterium]|nr:tol-pal system-associated acyl-CoA thioesterase [Steroidobacteraceae bacterium]
MSAFRFPVRVYWEDTDGAGIVYYASYLRFLERARTEWLRSLGHSQQQLARERGVVFTVVSLSVDYRAPARLDDELEVTCEPIASGAASLSFAQRIYRKGRDREAAAAPLLEARVRVACVDARTLRPQRLPPFLAPVLNAESAGGG